MCKNRLKAIFKAVYYAEFTKKRFMTKITKISVHLNFLDFTYGEKTLIKAIKVIF